jgi:hypothetical protein
MRPGENEAPRIGSGIHRTFHGGEALRRCLPFVQQDRLGHAAQDGIRVGAKGRGLTGNVEADH